MNLENYPNTCKDCEYLIKNPILCDEYHNKIRDFDENYCNELEEFINTDNLNECSFKKIKVNKKFDIYAETPTNDLKQRKITYGVVKALNEQKIREYTHIIEAYNDLIEDILKGNVILDYKIKELEKTIKERKEGEIV